MQILDEPTSALDAETEHALFEQYASSARGAADDGRITILVSHRFSTVRMADLIVVLDGSRLVGASTGTPMEDHADDFARAFDGKVLALTDIFYCAESVLLPEYRGRGIGHAFFDAREDHARRLGRKVSAFCGVQRPADHPARPADYAPLDPFWRKRGYAPMEGVIAEFAWRDVGETDETAKPMQFWSKTL